MAQLSIALCAVQGADAIRRRLEGCNETCGPMRLFRKSLDTAFAMHPLSPRSGTSSFTYTAPVEEAQNHLASAPANASPAAATTATAQASEERQRPVPMLSLQAQLLRQTAARPAQQSRQDALLSKAFDTQRLAINTQAGPSNSAHLNALDRLQQRHFKPAAGGLEIPFKPNSLLGGGKRTNHFGSSSRDVRLCPREAAAGLRQEIDDQRQAIVTLTQALQIARSQGNPDLIRRSEQRLHSAQEELFNLRSRYTILVQEYQNINNDQDTDEN